MYQLQTDNSQWDVESRYRKEVIESSKKKYKKEKIKKSKKEPKKTNPPPIRDALTVVSKRSLCKADAPGEFYRTIFVFIYLVLLAFNDFRFLSKSYNTRF